MGEVKRYDMLIDYGCSKFDSPEIDPHEIKDGYWVKHSDYATLEAERDALRAEVAKLRAACAAKDGALGICQDMLTFVNESSKQYKSSVVVALRTVAAALSDTAGAGWIDAMGATLVVPTQYGIDFTLNLEHDGQCFRLADGDKWNPGDGWIDATGAVEGRVQKLPVPASGWAGGTSLEHVTIPREWAGSRVLIVRVEK